MYYIYIEFWFHSILYLIYYCHSKNCSLFQAWTHAGILLKHKHSFLVGCASISDVIAQVGPPPAPSLHYRLFVHHGCYWLLGSNRLDTRNCCKVRRGNKLGFISRLNELTFAEVEWGKHNSGAITAYAIWVISSISLSLSECVYTYIPHSTHSPLVFTLIYRLQAFIEQSHLLYSFLSLFFVLAQARHKQVQAY